MVFEWLKSHDDRFIGGFIPTGSWHTNKNVVSAFDALVSGMNMCLLDSMRGTTNIPNGTFEYRQGGKANVISDLITLVAINHLRDLEELIKANFPNDPMICTKFIQKFHSDVIESLTSWFAIKREDYDESLNNIINLKSDRAVLDANSEWQNKYKQTVADNVALLKKEIDEMVKKTIKTIEAKYKSRLEKKLKKLSENIDEWVKIIEGLEREHKIPSDSDLKIALLDLKEIADKKSGKLKPTNVKTLKSFLRPNLRYWFVITKDSKFFVDPINNGDVVTNEIVTNFIYCITESTAKKEMQGWLKNYKGK